MGYFEPDAEQDLIMDEFRKMSNQDKPYLSELIYQSGKRVQFNNFRFQKQREGIATCGR